jgi:hypothetical protein
MLSDIPKEYETNSIQKIGVIIKDNKATLTGNPCTIESACIPTPVENSTNTPNIAPNTGMNISKQSTKLLTKIADVKEAKVSFSLNIVFTLSESKAASSSLKGIKVPATVTNTDKSKINTKEYALFRLIDTVFQNVKKFFNTTHPFFQFTFKRETQKLNVSTD